MDEEEERLAEKDLGICGKWTDLLLNSQVKEGTRDNASEFFLD